MKHTYPSSRYIAAEVLCQLYASKQALKPILDGMCTRHRLPANERNLAMNICFGILRNRQSIDQIIRSLISLRLKKLNPHLHQALAVGLYQIFYLDNIPESAAVNEAVKSCQRAKLGKHLQSFANAVLRNAIRKRDELEKNIASPQHNHPDWMVARWVTNYSKEVADRICTINGREPQLCLRVQKAHIKRYKELLTEHNIAFTVGHLPEAIILPDYRGAIGELPGFAEGLFQVQDQAAQLASHLLAPFDRDDQISPKYLDCCAGLGGKSGHIIDLIPENAEFIALEPEEHRAHKFKENMTRLFPTRNICLHQSFAQEFAREYQGERFAGIFVDAPCSGTGVIRRQPDIRWNRTEDDFAKYSCLQLEILSSVAPLLADDGVLVYATCSIEPEENLQVVDTFLEAHPEFELSPVRGHLPETAQSFIVKYGESDVFAPTPSEDMDGFFAARLVKKK